MTKLAGDVSRWTTLKQSDGHLVQFEHECHERVVLDHRYSTYNLTLSTAFFCETRQSPACFCSHHQTSCPSVSLDRRIVSRLVVSEHAVHGSVRLVLCSLLKAARLIVAWCRETSPR